MKVKRCLMMILLLGLLGCMFTAAPVMAANNFNPNVNPSPVLPNRDGDDDNPNKNDDNNLVQSGALLSPQTGDSRPMPIYLLALGVFFAGTAMVAGSHLKKE